MQFPPIRNYWSELLSSSAHNSDDEPSSARQSLSPPSFGDDGEFPSPRQSVSSAHSTELPSTPPRTPPPATTDEDIARLYGFGGVESSPTTPMDILHMRNRELREQLQTNMQPSVAARKRLRNRMPRTVGEDGTKSPGKRTK